MRKTKFWRFAYEEDQLEQILRSHTVFYPSFQDWPKAKNNSKEKIEGDLDVGDFILLANFDRTSGIGTVRGVGKITSLSSEGIQGEWRKAIPRWSLTPEVSGGVQQWLKEGVFNFDTRRICSISEGVNVFLKAAMSLAMVS